MAHGLRLGEAGQAQLGLALQAAQAALAGWEEWVEGTENMPEGVDAYVSATDEEEDLGPYQPWADDEFEEELDDGDLLELASGPMPTASGWNELYAEYADDIELLA